MVITPTTNPQKLNLGKFYDKDVSAKTQKFNPMKFCTHMVIEASVAIMETCRHVLSAASMC